MSEASQNFSYSQKPFLFLLIVSLLIHGIIVFVVKKSDTKEITHQELIEVDLVPIELPPDIQKPLIGKPKINSTEKATTADKAKATPIEKPTLAVESNLTSLVRDDDQKTQAAIGKTSLTIPTVIDAKQLTESKLVLKKPVDSGLLEKAAAASVSSTQNQTPGDVAVDDLLKKDVIGEVRSPIAQNNITNSIQEGSDTDEASGNTVAGVNRDILFEGEIKDRKVLYKPDPPQLNLDRDITVILRFTVLPNGDVDQVFPYQKADPELERTAIDLLHQYRFEPLFGSTKIQTGIIHFTIHRRQKSSD